MLTRCYAKYATLEAAKGVWYTFGDYSFEGFLLVRTESKEYDAIDLGKISKLLSHVDQSLKNSIAVIIVIYLMKHNQSHVIVTNTL